MQSAFKSRAHYVEWRAHWRRDYKHIAEEIKQAKHELHTPGNNAPEFYSERNRIVSHLRQSARSMMMAREASKAAYVAMKRIMEQMERMEDDTQLQGFG